MNVRLPVYAKGLIAGGGAVVIAVLEAVKVATTDDQITLAEWAVIFTAFAAAVAVWRVPNAAPLPPAEPLT